MVKKAFTLIEIIIALVIIGILATLGIPTYRNSIEDSRARVCETNLRALKTALDIYAMENDFMPASLGALPQEYINKAYAQVMQQPDAWKTKLAYSILEWSERGLAYAAPNFLFILAKRNLSMITCPSVDPDYRPYSFGGVEISFPSYVMNGILAEGTVAGIGMASLTYRALAPNTILISDSAAVHKHVHTLATSLYSIGITRNGNITFSN